MGTLNHNLIDRCSLCMSDIAKEQDGYKCTSLACGVYDVLYPYGVEQDKYHGEGTLIFAVSANKLGTLLSIPHKVTQVKESVFAAQCIMLVDRYTFDYNGLEVTPDIDKYYESTDTLFCLNKYTLGSTYFFAFHSNPMYLHGEITLLDFLKLNYDVELKEVGECYTYELVEGLHNPKSAKAFLFTNLCKALDLTPNDFKS